MKYLDPRFSKAYMDELNQLAAKTRKANPSEVEVSPDRHRRQLWRRPSFIWGIAMFTAGTTLAVLAIFRL